MIGVSFSAVVALFVSVWCCSELPQVCVAGPAQSILMDVHLWPRPCGTAWPMPSGVSDRVADALRGERRL